MGTGTIEKPDVTFSSSDKDWVALSNGKLGGTWAYLSGRLKISGDQSVAKKLGEIFHQLTLANVRFSCSTINRRKR